MSKATFRKYTAVVWSPFKVGEIIKGHNGIKLHRKYRFQKNVTLEAEFSSKSSNNKLDEAFAELAMSILYFHFTGISLFLIQAQFYVKLRMQENLCLNFILLNHPF